MYIRSSLNRYSVAVGQIFDTCPLPREVVFRSLLILSPLLIRFHSSLFFALILNTPTVSRLGLILTNDQGFVGGH